MASNLYHLLHFIPAIERWEMPRGLEALAQQLVESGKLRVNADHARNFVRLGDMTFSARELTDPKLRHASDARIRRHVAPAAGEAGIRERWDYLHRELKKARGLEPEKELRVARVLVQSAHPSVIRLLLMSGTEIFVSYAHNVADLMPVHEWQRLGENSGLQATDADGAQVYVSAGGDPFFEGEHKTYTTDGFPALARMTIIAGQELAHFADLRRAPGGRVLGRFSTDMPQARTARIADIGRVRDLAAHYHEAGLPQLLRAEQGVAFYSKRWRYSPPWMLCQLWRLWQWGQFKFKLSPMNLLKKRGFNGDSLNLNCPHCPHCRFPPLMAGEAIAAYLSDMQYNLAPDSEVYRHDDPEVEEAIATIEAVARVPQQEHKWGKAAVADAWPELSRFYHEVVLAAAEPLAPMPRDIENIDLLQKLMIYLRRATRPKPGYYP